MGFCRHQVNLLHRHDGQAWQVLNEPGVPGEVCVDVAASPLFHFPGYIKCVCGQCLAVIQGALGNSGPAKIYICPSSAGDLANERVFFLPLTTTYGRFI